ncbi:hypothetical protein FRC07_000416 [Ceratobasidium sp. 392]|nr:hypothetical protein FRC07_000416 [Ceratobasidium sp. 392]
MAAARADMVEFNQRCAEDHTPTFVHNPVEERLPNELLSNDNKERTHAATAAAGEQPILTLAKIHLFVFALCEGIYQTRATFLHWAALIHKATWQMELPNVPYVAASMAELEIVNGQLPPTLHGKMKERIRPIIANSHGFEHCAVTQQTIQDNLDQFHKIYPNSFHCTSTRPRTGHYKHPNIGHCIAASLFYGPNSPGALFPDYMEDMPLTLVVFILTLVNAILRQGVVGRYFVSCNLGALKMLNKYKAHLAGLKDLRKVAPRLVVDLQNRWFEYASEYSGASFVCSRADQPTSQQSEMRPDTPEPEPLPEPPAKGSSCRSTSCQALSPALSVTYPDPDLFLDDERDQTLLPDKSCCPSPVEDNKHGCVTAASKGKGRADD